MEDKNKLYTYEYPRPAVTTDCVVFGYDLKGGLSVLLIERGADPYKGRWAFPGGFLNMDEKADDGAARELKEETGLPVHTTYGSMTKTMRRYFCIEKTHANDAFVMGMFHPKHRQRERLYVKQRRNDRVLSKFYDAVYIDTRDGKERSGRSLSCGRTKRSQPRRSVNNRRVFRGDKLKKGRVSIRRRRTDLKPGSIVMYM
jgi:8-oxo-dGTP pyrophosphatase MutT (NUDIX family)